MINISFEKANLNPTGEINRDLSHTAVNAVAIATGKPWKQVVKSLIEQAHIRAYITTNVTVITDMIRALGFKKINSYTSLDDLLESNKSSTFLIKMHYRGYYALIPNGNGFAMKGFDNNHTAIPAYKIEEIWQYYPETDNRTGITRKKVCRKTHDDSAKFIGKNINPHNNSTGDCAIRALGGALDCTWHEALDHLAQATDYSEPIVNHITNINLTLTKLGFRRQKAITSGGRFITGSELCSILSHTYFRGERIFVYVKPSHCAAILPEKQEDGSYVYKIQDSWNCTNKKMGEYWVLLPEKETKQNAPEVSILHVNEKVSHPKYGEGTIIRICPCNGTNLIEIDFNSHGIKKIAESWFIKNKTV